MGNGQQGTGNGEQRDLLRGFKAQTKHATSEKWEPQTPCFYGEQLTPFFRFLFPIPYSLLSGLETPIFSSNQKSQYFFPRKEPD